MKIISIIILSIFSLNSYSQEKEAQEAKHPVGIGLRVGDFTGLSTQYFLTDSRLSIGLDIGRSYFWGENHEKRFEKYAESEGIEYTIYDKKGWVEGPSYGFKFNMCKYGLLGNVPHFYWYGGAGFQMRRFQLDHSYQVEVTAANSTVVKEKEVQAKRVKHHSYGIDFIIGSEYVFQEFPLTVFVDFTLFVEAQELPSQIMRQIGLGARVHF